MLEDYPQRSVPVFVRPWVDAKMIHGHDPHFGRERAYPREWRVFVHDGVVAGVSNYYLQAPLPESEDDYARAMASELTERVNAVIDILHKHAARPHHPHLEDERADGFDSLDMTLDFLEPADGRPPMFLEGGPPKLPFWGAHPCCFAGQDRIDGIAVGNDRVLSWDPAPGLSR